MTERRPGGASAFSHFLAANHPTGPDYIVRGVDGEVIAAKWRRPASHNAMEVTLAEHTLMYHVGGSTSVAKFVDGSSKYHFIRTFRAATQRTPYAYLVERRLVLAVDALLHTTAPIERIARDVGFQSAPGFSNVFKKPYGISPSEFRARSH